MKKILLYIFAFIIVILTVAVGIDCYHLTVKNFQSKDGEAHLIYVYPETTIDSLISTVQIYYDVQSRLSLKLHCRLMHFNSPKTGCYRLENIVSDKKFISMFRNGEQTPVKLTIHRIRTREQLAGKLSEALLLDSTSIISRLEDNQYMQQFGLKKETAVCLFIPDTYEVYWTITPDALFKKMQQAYQHYWNSSRLNQAKKIGFTPTEVATIASIAESETNKDFEYPIIAGLYINRLHKGMPLQACPTVIFAWQDFSMRRVLKRHLEIDSPYNTYKYKGLPPGPIRIPRASTMDAVLNYTPSNYLFMCASADFNGTHHFSATYQQHAQYAKQYQQELNKRHIQ